MWPRADARLLEFRLYYEAGGNLFTDGYLHQSKVQADAAVSMDLAIAAQSHIRRAVGQSSTVLRILIRVVGPRMASGKDGPEHCRVHEGLENQKSIPNAEPNLAEART